MPALRLQFCGKAEVVVTAEEFEPSAELYQGQELLGKKYLGRDPAVDDHGLSMIIDSEGQAFVIGLRHRVGQLSAVAGMYRHPTFAPGPASLVVMKNPKPDKAVQ